MADRIMTDIVKALHEIIKQLGTIIKQNKTIIAKLEGEEQDGD